MTDDKNFYSHGEWTRVKNSHINYDKKTCQVCDKKYEETNKFNVNHIIMRKLLPEDQWYDKTNLWTLCTCCMGLNKVLNKFLMIINYKQLQNLNRLNLLEITKIIVKQTVNIYF